MVVAIPDVDFDRQYIAALVEQEAQKFEHRHERRLTMWKYEQDTGNLYNPDGAFVATGYAGGDGGKQPDGVNNHELQEVHSVGPLPCGVYSFGFPIEHSQLGPFAIPLQPGPDNEMFGRSGFYMHGDTPAMNHSASDGCIIMPISVRKGCWTSDDHHLIVQISEVK